MFFPRTRQGAKSIRTSVQLVANADRMGSRQVLQ